jgi:hypothetical protein
MLLHRLCYGSKCCSMLAALCWKSSGNCEDFKFWCGEEQERTWQTDIEQIFQPNLTEEFSICTYGTKEENLVDVGKSRHTKMCRDQNCVGPTGAFRSKVPTFGCRGDMSPTCRRLSQPRSHWWPPGGYNMNTHPMAASSEFQGSHGHAALGDAACIASTPPHGHRNGLQWR